MEIACFDLEGVFVPEIWISVAEQTGIDQLRLTTRDVSDYDQLMHHRLGILAEYGLGLPDIQNVIARLNPLPGAREFLAWARTWFQVVIVSDTFYEFAGPLMKQLDYPVLLCHNLEVDQSGAITGYAIRLAEQKQAIVKGFHSLNFSVFAVGDSYNDTGMLREADHGFLFNPPRRVAEEFPDLPVTTSYAELQDGFVQASSRSIGVQPMSPVRL